MLVIGVQPLTHDSNIQWTLNKSSMSYERYFTELRLSAPPLYSVHLLPPSIAIGHRWPLGPESPPPSEVSAARTCVGGVQGGARGGDAVVAQRLGFADGADDPGVIGLCRL